MPRDDAREDRHGLTADKRVSLSDASKFTGRNRKTLAGDIRAGRLPNALQSSVGRKGWTVLVQDLVDAGFLPADELAAVEANLRSAGESDELRKLRAQVADLETRLAVQTALAEERRDATTAQRELTLSLIARVEHTCARCGGGV